MIGLSEKDAHRRGGVEDGNRFMWGAAVLASMLLNIGLFALLPGLVDWSVQRPGDHDRVATVNFIRIKRPEMPPKKPEKMPPELEKTEPRKAAAKKTVIQKDVIRARVVPIPFELNPRLPPLPDSLPTPDIKMVSAPPVSLKSIYGIGELDKDLTPLATAPPVYPFRAKRMNIEGWVDVKFLVGENGSVETVEILGAQPSDIFEQSVVQCVSGWRFVPGTVEGVPVKVWVERKIRFVLE
jgi:protein TonB